MLKNYNNHFIENGVLYRGPTTKRVVKPDNRGIYKIKHQGEVNYHTLDELLNQVQDPEESKVKQDIFNPSVVIYSHLQGKGTSDIVTETGKSPSYINAIKSKFVGVNRYETICNNFKTKSSVIKDKYGINYNISELDREDKLRLLARYLDDHCREYRPSLEDLCSERGYSSKAMSNWLKYNGYNQDKMSYEERMSTYEGRVPKAVKTHKEHK